MEFKETKTYTLLARSFAGECMAGMRYQILSDYATQQGYSSLATELQTLAKNETFHAKRLMQLILTHANECKNIDICAGYPFDGETLESGLKGAIDAEKNEARIYLEFADIAQSEGFEDVANTFKHMSAVEQEHKNKFAYLYKAFVDASLYKSTEKRLYRCENCGHTYEDYEAWTICPLCRSSQGFVEINYPCEIKNEKNQTRISKND